MTNHIRNVAENTKAWCGQNLHESEFHFKDAETAAFYATLPEHPKTACKLCISKIRNNLWRLQDVQEE